VARFNAPAVERTRTVNRAGGEAFTESPKLALASLVLTSFAQEQFYRSANETLAELRALVRTTDPQFVAKTGVFARNQYGMRSITHALTAELAAVIKGERWLREFVRDVVRRPDDMTEILSYWLAVYGKPIPNALKRGLADAFAKFDRYQLAKYRGEGKALSLVDVANLVHPKPIEKNADALRELVAGTLRSEDTWEAELTRAGSDGEAKVAAWMRLVRERQIGYFALLRNLRNICEQAPELIPDAADMLTDESLIRGSLVLPFRFTTALGAFVPPRQIITALNKAVDISLANVPRLGGRTLVALDGSGSMMGRPVEIGSLFAAVLVKALDADYLTFDNTADYQSVNPADSTLTIAGQMAQNVHGGGTDFHSIFQAADHSYERIIILSDMQGWIGYNAPTQALAAYRARTDSDPHIFSFDLQGYGTLQFPQRHVYCMAGFSEKVLDVMAALEEDKQALIRRIEAA
jgi:60 kDa SS-A/Ro ribonucleoprotein